MKKRSISKQLIIGNFTIMTSMIILLGIAVSLLFVKSMNEEINSKNAIITMAYQEKVNHYLEGPISALKNLTVELKGVDIKSQKGSLYAHFSAVLSTFPYMESLRLFDSNGEVVLAMPGKGNGGHANAVYEDFFRVWPKQGDVEWSNIFISKEGNPTIALTASVSEYLIVATLDIGMLHESFALGQKSHDVKACLVNKNGIFISSDEINDVRMRKRHPSFSILLENLKSKSEPLHVTDDRKKMLMIIPLEGSKEWYLIVEYDRNELYRPIMAMILQISFMALVILVAVITLIRKLTGSIIYEMSDLNIAALKIAEGDYGHKLNHYVFKEFEDLSLSISRLTDTVKDRENRIKSVNANLELLVDQRTDELIQTNALLQESNAQLEAEVSEREKAEEKLNEMNQNLSNMVTERTRTLLEKELDLENALNAEKAATEEKSRFFADMSHEIRTPLNGLIGIVETFKHTKMNKDQEKITRSMENCSVHLSSIINDVLDYSKIESGKFELDEQMVDMAELMETLIDVFSYIATQKGIKLVDTSPVMDNVYYKTDGPRIRQVLSNIISNAIKFTKEGQIEINSVFEKLNDSESIATFSIKDMGDGIPEEALDRIFSRFEQSKENKSSTRGSGLGLAIAKRITEVMGGSISVTSQLGVGSVFKVVLPMKHLEAGSTPVFVKKSIGSKGPTGTILVAEDDPTSMMVLKIILEKSGHSVTVVTNGQEALDEISLRNYDILLLDINMPVLDGVETIKKIRANPNADISKVKAIALTAYAMKGDKEKFIEVGMDDYISKPIDFEFLMTKINGYLLDKGIVENVSQKQVTGSNPTRVIDLERKLSEASGLEAEKCQYIIEVYIQESRQLIARLHEAYEIMDFEELQKIFHQIKGSSGNVRATELSEMAANGEKAAIENDRDKIGVIIGTIEADVNRL